MNLGDPELELVDPTPNIHSLFLHFDKVFFWTKLASRAVVRWSKKMYSCAGICSYDKGGLCDIAISEPLLKLRPRKDLVETLLHEMIHAYLFITNKDCDRDGHGPNFKAHMHRINDAAGLNISIYHNFHDEVKLYQTHWWRCNGPCQTKKPHFGIVRRTNNRAPSPKDYWWDDHKRKCGGIFIKIKEPQKEDKKQEKKRASPNPCGDITKYINNNNIIKEIAKPVLKEHNKVPDQTNFIKNSNSTIVISKRNNVVFNPQVTKSSNVFSGKGEVITQRKSTDLNNVTETVRNAWANKTIPSIFPNPKKNTNNKTTKQDLPKSNKHKADSTHVNSPPPKVKKIDDYFKSTSILKDIYGTDFEIKQENKNKRLSIVSVQPEQVDCPVCGNKISSEGINTHLDECLNKDVIKNICNEPLTIVKNEVVEEEIGRISKIKTENSEKNITNCISNNNNVHTNANIKADPDKLLIPKPEKLDDNKSEVPKIKIEPGTSKELDGMKCPCCNKNVNNINDHLDECLAFFNNDETIPTEGASTSATETIVIDDDDEFDESFTLNATGTKLPCPCCMRMIEQNDMNDHLDTCLSA